MENTGNIAISGMGTMDGGEFNNVSISGMGTIQTDLVASSIQVSGNGVFKGDVSAKSLSASGRIVFEKEALVEKAEISGSCECKGNLKLKDGSISGRIATSGLLKGGHVEVTGYLNANGDVETDKFVCKGSFMIEGLLNSEIIDISIGGFCVAKEIGCEKIYVTLGKLSGTIEQIINFVYSAFSGKNIANNRLKADSIEASEVNIECTDAGIVRGRVVHIRQGCQIQKVEYSESLIVHPGSTVVESVKV